MRFGLFCSAQANARELGLEIGQGFRDYLDFNVEAEALGFHSSFLVEHHFTGWNQVSTTLMLLTCLAMKTTTLRLLLTISGGKEQLRRFAHEIMPKFSSKRATA